MPNWCYNNLYISVKNNKQLEKVIQAITNDSEHPFDFNRIIPMPEELNVSAPNRVNPDELKAKYGFSDWYEWRVVNWGTKWNASDVELNLESPKEISIRFNTAWSPPTPILEAIGKKFPFASLVLDWEEESGYYGKIEIEDSVVVTNYDGEIDCAYRIEHWGDCVSDCENCGECDCEVCNCPNRSIQTICSSCNSGKHAISEGEENETDTKTDTD